MDRTVEKFICHVEYGSGLSCDSLENEHRVVQLTNEMDIYDICKIDVTKVLLGIKITDDYTTIDVLQSLPLHYAGWLPGCHIVYKDENNNVVIDGYGEDH